MTQNTGMRNLLSDAFRADLAGGLLRIYTAGDVLLAEITLPSPAFGASVAGVVSKSGTWSTVAVATGTAAKGRIYNAGETDYIEFTVGEGSGELSLDETDIVIGNAVVISVATYTQPAA